MAACVEEPTGGVCVHAGDGSGVLPEHLWEEQTRSGHVMYARVLMVLRTGQRNVTYRSWTGYIHILILLTLSFHVSLYVIYFNVLFAPLV